MALSAEQIELYFDRINVYRGASSGSDTEADNIITSTPHLSSIPCYFESTPNYDKNYPIGMSKEQNVFTSDKMHTEAGVDIITGDLILITTSGKPYLGECLMVTGEVRAKTMMANKQSFYMKRVPAPSSLSSTIAGLS